MLMQIFRVRKFGFTLIELIVTCSIIALLAVIGVPIYTKYRLRAKVAAMVSAASAAQYAVSNSYFDNNYSFDNANYAANSQPFLKSEQNYISSIAIENGWVRVTGDPEYLGDNQIDLAFAPVVENNNITWTCYISPSYFDYAPESCRNEGCAVYTWGPWSTVDSGTTWLYNGNPATLQTTWNSYCAASPWFFGCTCYNATDTNLVKYDLDINVISNNNNGWGWTYLVVNFDCRQARREMTVIGSCDSCPGDSTCQDMFTPLS